MNDLLFRTSFLCAAILILVSCGENIPSAASGPDYSGLDSRDHNYFNKIYDRCSINNTTNDCNCVARVNVEHRAAAYESFKADYDVIHKPQLEADILKLSATVAEKTKNASDPRVIEALEQDLRRMEQKLETGIDNIDDFELPFLPSGATDMCVMSK